MSMLELSSRAGARGRSLVAGLIAVVCHEKEMLGRQNRLDDLSYQNMYTIPVRGSNDGFLKLVKYLCYAGTRLTITLVLMSRVARGNRRLVATYVLILVS